MLAVKGVSKQFGALRALSDVSIDFHAGRVHAVVGENGAGKSTLMNIIGGFLRPDSGDISFDGKPWPLGDPEACRRIGLGMVHQHFTLVPSFTVRENLALARLPKLVAGLDLPALSKSALDQAARLNWIVDPEARVRDLPVGSQQRVEILKALDPRNRIVLFDEPTAPLSAAEVADLLQVLRNLASEGLTVIVIAHKLSEVLEIADDISVLRRGRLVWKGPRAGVTAEELAHQIVGEMPPRREFPNVAEGRTVAMASNLVISGDRGELAVKGVSFEIRQGETLGIGGVDGNGQIELAEALAGIRPVNSGRLEAPESGYIPGDRQGEGLAMGMTVGENLTLGALGRDEVSGRVVLSARHLQLWCEGLIHDYAIKASGPDEKISDLSGGNQQKVVVSRSLDGKPELIIAVNPTRGLDIRAAEFVHEQLRAARARGAAIALFSPDLDELNALSDRIVYMSKGEIYEGEGPMAVLGA